MKNKSQNILAILFFMGSLMCHAQYKNQRTDTVKIYGNCDMCKANIEKAGTIKKQAKVVWNKNTKMAVITYDAVQTNKATILKKIALAGYDNELYAAPNTAYALLHGCCQYKREVKPKK